MYMVLYFKNLDTAPSLGAYGRAVPILHLQAQL